MHFIFVLSFLWSFNLQADKTPDNNPAFTRCAPTLVTELNNTYIDVILKVKITNAYTTNTFDVGHHPALPAVMYWGGFSATGTSTTWEITYYTEVQDPSVWGSVYIKDNQGNVIACQNTHYGTNVVTFPNIDVSDCNQWRVGVRYNKCQ